jgi:hypothetical protein
MPEEFSESFKEQVIADEAAAEKEFQDQLKKDEVEELVKIAADDVPAKQLYTLSEVTGLAIKIALLESGADSMSQIRTFDKIKAALER